MAYHGKSRRFWLIAFMAALAGTSIAQNDAFTLSIDSPAYGLLVSMYLELGLAEPEAVKPVTVAEIKHLMDRISREDLSSAGRKAYDEVEKEIAPKQLYSEKNLSFRTSPSLVPEGFLHVNLGQDGSQSLEDYRWLYGYEKRHALLDIPLEVSFADSLFGVIELSAKEEHNTVESGVMADGTTFPSGVTNNYANLIFDDPNPRIDLSFPFRAFMAGAGEWWSIRFGRDKLSWGNGSTGNLMLSDYSDFYDFIGYSLWGENFKWSAVYLSMDPFPPWGSNTWERTGGTYAFIGHRMDFRILKRFLVSVSESVTFGASVPAGSSGGLGPDYLRDLNSLMVFHNWTDPDRMNSLLTVELSANPWRYMSIYAQGAMDELRTAYETAGDGGGGPGIFGGLGGLRAAVPCEGGYLTLDAEAAATSPWLYNRRQEPYYYNVRRYWSLTTNKLEFVVKPIGYRYGPDSIVLDFSARYESLGKWRAEMELLHLAQGEKTIFSPWNPNAADTFPSGVVERRTSLTLGGGYDFSEWLNAGAECSFSWTTNVGHVSGTWSGDMEVSIWAGLRLP